MLRLQYPANTRCNTIHLSQNYEVLFTKTTEEKSNQSSSFGYYGTGDRVWTHARDNVKLQW